MALPEGLPGLEPMWGWAVGAMFGSSKVYKTIKLISHLGVKLKFGWENGALLDRLRVLEGSALRMVPGGLNLRKGR